MSLNELDLTALKADRREKRRGERLFYQGGNVSRLNQDWVTLPTTPDQEARFNLRRLRARARDLVRNNAHAKRFIALTKANVVGPNGFRLRGRLRAGDGSLDTEANKALERAWRRWGRAEFCTVDGKLNLIQAQQHAIASWAMDGEVLIRKVRGRIKGQNNEFGFALQFLDPDQLDETHSIVAGPGQNEIRLGVEIDGWGRAVAYHILTRHPNDFIQPGERERIPADQIIHLFKPYRVNQTRGVTPFAPVMADLRMLGGYREAELVGARAGASKIGIIENDPATYTVEDSLFTPEKALRMDFNPGTIEELPPGKKFVGFDSNRPSQAYKEFEKAILQSISSGLSVPYVSLSSNLEGVNYSSIRQGVLDARDEWRMLQVWMTEQFMRAVYEAWLPMAELTGKIETAGRELDEFEDVDFMARGWDWVDPLKDIQASVLAIDAKLDTRQATVAQEGRDISEIIEALAEEAKLIQKFGLDPELPDIKGMAGKETDAAGAAPADPNANKDDAGTIPAEA